MAWKVFSLTAGLGLIIVALLLLYSNWKILAKTMDSVKYRKIAEANVRNLLEREVELGNKINELETENGIDKEIRQRFPVAKPGEEVFMIVSNRGTAASPAEAAEENGTLWGTLLKWWDSL